MISLFIFFFFNDTATTEIYTLSLHDALPICAAAGGGGSGSDGSGRARGGAGDREPAEDARGGERALRRSEEHTSELQSPCNLVCRLLLEKKKKKKRNTRVAQRETDESTLGMQ